MAGPLRWSAGGAASAGRKHDLVFVDPVIVTMVVLRLQVPHAALAPLYEVDRSTISRPVRPLLGGRGYATPTRG